MIGEAVYFYNRLTHTLSDKNSWKFDSDVIFSADRDTNVSSQKKSGGRRILQEEFLFKKQIASPIECMH